MLRNSTRISTLVLIMFAAANSAFSQSRPKGSLIDTAVLLDDIRILSGDDMGGRSASNPAMQKARDYIQKRFREAGILPLDRTYEQEFKITIPGKARPLKGVNFVGVVRGVKNPEKYIVISAHYDHLGIQNGEIYNGADDNASGTSALFALAKEFHDEKPRNSIIFVAFDAEETESQGSKYFVAHVPVKKG